MKFVHKDPITIVSFEKLRNGLKMTKDMCGLS